MFMRRNEHGHCELRLVLSRRGNLGFAFMDCFALLAMTVAFAVAELVNG